MNNNLYFWSRITTVGLCKALAQPNGCTLKLLEYILLNIILILGLALERWRMHTLRIITTLFAVKNRCQKTNDDYTVVRYSLNGLFLRI